MSWPFGPYFHSNLLETIFMSKCDGFFIKLLMETWCSGTIGQNWLSNCSKYIKLAQKVRLKCKCPWSTYEQQLLHLLSIFSLYSLDRIPPNSPFNPTVCQNVMLSHQILDGNMKFRYSLIIIDPQIDPKASYFTKNEIERQI